MPSRWSELDTDAEHLPHGVECIGYDADTQVYTFRDTDGSLWEGAPGCRYGAMHQVSGPSTTAARPLSPLSCHEEDEEETIGSSGPFLGRHKRSSSDKISWRSEMMPLLNFFLLVAVALLVLMYVLGRAGSGKEIQRADGSNSTARECTQGMEKYVVKLGDTCWAVAQDRGIEVADLVRGNEALDCDKLAVGEVLCLMVPLDV